MVWQTVIMLLAAPAAMDTAAANQAILDCYTIQARQFDDGTSDPYSIAKVLTARCDDQLQIYAAIATKGQKRADRKRYYLLEALRADLDTPAMVVLQVRKQTR